MSSHQVRTPAGVREGGQFATAPRAESPVHLHVGVSPGATALVESIGAELAGIDTVLAEGDSWSEWDEPDEVGDVQHLVLEAPDTESATKVARALDGAGVLQRAEDRAKTLWAVTDSEVWSELITSDTSPEPVYLDPTAHDFCGPSAPFVAEGNDPDACGECGMPRDEHRPPAAA